MTETMPAEPQTDTSFKVWAPGLAESRTDSEYRTLKETAIERVYIDERGELWIDDDSNNPRPDEQNDVSDDFRALVGDEFGLYYVAFERLQRRGYTTDLEPDGVGYAYLFEISWSGTSYGGHPNPEECFNEVMNSEMPLEVVVDQHGQRWQFSRWSTRSLQYHGPAVTVRWLEGEEYPHEQYGHKTAILDMEIDWAATAEANGIDN